MSYDLTVLNLGAGVQSTTLYAWACDGELKIDVAIFADTGDEPKKVYEHIEFLKSLGGPEICVVRRSETSLGDNLARGMNATGQRHISIPAFLATEDGSAPALGRRQCTSEYKLVPIRQEIRRRLGVGYGERVPRGVKVLQYMGLSFDEPKRVANTRARYQSEPWSDCAFPLFDEFMTRADCVAYLATRFPGYEVPRSACVYCPFKNDAEWLRTKAVPEDWARAVEVDRSIRAETSACRQGMIASQYVHRSCKPLDEVEFVRGKRELALGVWWWRSDCEGMCGV